MALSWYSSAMPRKARIEFEGAVYHVMCRGNRSQCVFRDEHDNKQFLETLRETCGRCGWRVHAFVLMGNHYHLLLETPEANLVAGMQWLQGTYTKRYNVRHKEWGHLFQGRYKALLVSGAPEYFSTAASYVHLNPARIKGYDFDQSRLENYLWSSYPSYLTAGKKPAWLCVDRVLGGLNLKDSPNGRKGYHAYIQKRLLEMRHSAEPWKADEEWKNIRRGWCFGDDQFRKDMVERLDGALESNRRDSFSGPEVKRHDELEAERLVELGMKTLALSEEDLDLLIKGSPEKYAIAWLVRKNTSARTQWIKERLKMGTATNFSDYLRRGESADPNGWGYQEFRKIQNINL
ncbi:MAG: transposase [Kiritimatiellales bacterium]|nr:transposase [Kiritimatiellales bacterium]